MYNIYGEEANSNSSIDINFVTYQNVQGDITIFDLPVLNFNIAATCLLSELSYRFQNELKRQRNTFIFIFNSHFLQTVYNIPSLKYFLLPISFITTIFTRFIFVQHKS